MLLLKRKPHVGVIAIGNALGNSIVSGLSTKQTEKQAERKGNEAFEKAKSAGMTDTQATQVAAEEMLSMLPPDKRKQVLIDNDGKSLKINFAGDNGAVDRKQGGLTMSLAGDDFRSRHSSLVNFISDEGLWGNNQMLGLATGLLDKRAAYYSYDSIAKRGQQAFDEGYNRGFVNSVRPGVRAQQQQQKHLSTMLSPNLKSKVEINGNSKAPALKNFSFTQASKDAYVAIPLENIDSSIVSFLAGDKRNNWIYPVGHQVSQRFLEHPALKIYREAYDAGDSWAIGSKTELLEQRFRYQYTTYSKEYAYDVVTNLGAWTEGAPYRDHGINSFGSMTVNGRIVFDKANNQKLMQIEIFNRWSAGSLTRNPFTREPIFDDIKILQPVDVRVQIEVKDKLW